MYLLKNKFCIIQQYLSRARFNVSNLIFIMKNAKKGYDYDQKVKYYLIYSEMLGNQTLKSALLVSNL